MRKYYDDCDAKYITVYLDGEKVERCRMADDEQGVVSVMVWPIKRDGYGDPEEILLHGEVKFEICHDRLTPLVKEKE
jgi:hypothetical protein